MDFAAGLERDGSVAVKFQLVLPAFAVVREAVRPQKQHRIDEAALRLRSHRASLADGSNQAVRELVARGHREPSRSFSFAFLTPSLGLVEAPSSQRSTCIIVIACFAVGSRTSMSSTVAGPTCSIHGSVLNVRTARIAASKSDSACTSTVCRMPRTSANETAQIRVDTAR